MAQSQAAADPSMEEILASIRKIIAEDGDQGRKSPRLAVVPEPQAKRPEPRDDEPELAAEPGQAEYSDDEAGDMPAEATRHDIEQDLSDLDEIEAALADQDAGETDMDEAGSIDDEEPIWNADEHGEERASDRGSAGEAAGRQPYRSEATRAAAGMERLESMMAGAAARDAAAVGRTLLSPRSDEAVQSAFNQLADIILSEQTRTLEDLVKEMMQPMLRHWLDDNLPVLVERLVREEIERVSRGRR